ncbi:MAG TPA: PilZ domain-containing protein [Polyangiales bacterium]
MYAAAVGTWNAQDQKCLLAAASHANTELDFASLDDATGRMEDHATEARCVFVPHDANLTAIVSRLRQRASLLTVPVIAVVSHPSELLYRTAFASGADDALVSGDRGGMTRRLANLRACTPKEYPAREQGLALVASADIGLRRTLGQSLRRAGFDVAYASDARSLIEVARAPRALALVVATETFPPLGGEAAVRSARTAAQRPNLPAMIVPDDGSATRSSGDMPYDADGKLLCFAEEVMSRDATDVRASSRLAYPTICAFRPAGVLQATYGLSHNISREGCFIRTLDAPKPKTELWLELRASESEHTVHLRGEVVWRREPGAVGATPFGFGLRLLPDHCPPTDLAQYVAGYDALRQKLVHGS